MKRCSKSSGVLVSSLVLVGVLASPVLAQDLPDVPDADMPCAPDVTGLRRAAVAHEGVPGLWFEREVARCMLGRVSILPLYVSRVGLLDQRLSLRNERDALQERLVALAEEGEQEAVGALEAAERGRREAVEELDAWYRHPALWVTIGGVVVVVLEVVAIWVFSELDRS
jgi:hypothetical protein